MAYPVSSIYDTCIRSPEAPLNISSNGTPYGVSAGLAGAGLTALQILANKIAPQSGASSQYADIVDPADCEHYCTVDTVATELDLIIRLSGQANIANIKGYGIQVLFGSNTIRISRIDSLSSVATLATLSQAVVGNDGVGIGMVGSTITAYFRSGLGGSWGSIGSTTDATYAAGGRRGITLAGSALRVSNVGGGAAVLGGLIYPIPLDGLGTYYRGLS